MLHSLPLDQKRAFLTFATGCDRAPVGGLGHLALLIQRAGPDTGESRLRLGCPRRRLAAEPARARGHACVRLFLGQRGIEWLCNE